MKLNPYHHSPEALAMYEPDWERKYWRAAAERDRWQDRVFYLEKQLARSAAKLEDRAYGDMCVLPNCPSPKVKTAELPLCRDHVESAYEDMWNTWRYEWQHYPQSVPEHVSEQFDTTERPWVVYYIQMGENIKIGRTSKLADRMRTFYAQPEQLLAVEPGVVVDGVTRESQRHREFAGIRVGSTELFSDSPQLRAHIGQVVSTFGSPQRFLESSAA